MKPKHTTPYWKPALTSAELAAIRERLKLRASGIEDVEALLEYIDQLREALKPFAIKLTFDVSAWPSWSDYVRAREVMGE